MSAPGLKLSARPVTMPHSKRAIVGDLLGVWRETRLMVLVAQTAAIYAAVLIPFKVGIPLIPGFAELRPANALPIVASLLFGPVAAWGAGIGNLIGDCFGTLSPASLFGFLGNFCYGYVPYLLWGRLGPLSSGGDPEPRSWRQAAEFLVVCTAASLACAVVIGWGADLLGLVPFGVLTTAIFLNNLVMAVLLAPPLLLFLAPRVARWGLRYDQLLSARGEAGAGAARPAEPTGAEAVATPAAGPLVDARDVSFTYHGGTEPALRGLSLAIRRGETVALMGRTGAGKSTLCYAMNGLVPQHIAGRWAGELLVHGRSTRTRPVWEQAGTVGVLFQEFEAQLISTNLLLELAFPLEHLPASRSLSPSEMADRIRRVMTLTGLAGLEQRDPLTLSGGQRQRLALATILVREPSLLVLDEPFTDLDPRGRRALSAVLSQLAQAGAALLTAEHDPEEAARARRICVLERGRLGWEGTPRELFARPEGLDAARRLGVQPLPLAACFTELGLSELPLTVEEAWQCCREDRLVLARPGNGGSLERQEPVPDGAPAAVALRDVVFDYGQGPAAVAGATLEIRQGDFVALVGANGSGKSTLASLIKGLRTPARGTVRVHGRDTRRLSPADLATAVGYVFQNPDRQIFAETVEEEVEFGLRHLGLPREERARRVSDALKAVGLEAPRLRRADPFSLPKGDRQRVAVASVLAERPGVLIFDEPTTGLDGVETEWMMQMIARLNRQGHTVIMITHNLPLAAAYARRCLLMAGGRILADGPLRDVFARLLDPELAGLAGLEVPPVTRFAAQCGATLLTADEVRRALRKR